MRELNLNTLAHVSGGSIDHPHIPWALDANAPSATGQPESNAVADGMRINGLTTIAGGLGSMIMGVGLILADGPVPVLDGLGLTYVTGGGAAVVGGSIMLITGEALDPSNSNGQSSELLCQAPRAVDIDAAAQSMRH